MAYCYFNGKVIDESQATIAIDNLGLQRGFGVFDFFRARNGKPTFFEDYLDRFYRSQDALQLSRKIEKEEVREAVSKLIEKNGFENGSFKLILLGDGTDKDLVLDPFFYIINASFSGSGMLQASNLISYEYIRETPLIKHINYFNSFQLQQKRMEAKAIDVLYHKDGLVTEASRSNLFIIKDGIVLTPEHGILHGITRKHVLKMMEGDWDYKITDITLQEVMDADEVFLTSTIKEVMPIVKIDGEKIGDGMPGPITTDLFENFQAYIKNLD